MDVSGILALPAATQATGFVPSTLGLIFMYVYMCSTGLLIAEVNLNLDTGSSATGGILSSAEATIGTLGSRVAGVAYLFIHYALLVAYCAQGGSVLPHPSGLEAFGSVLFPALFGGALFAGSPSVIEKVNSAAVGLVVATFVALVGTVSANANIDQLAAADWAALPNAVPVLFVALVFHNVVPTICAQLNNDANKVRSAIVAGSFVPTAMFCLWNGVILAASDGAGGDPLQALGDNPLVPAFSELAIVTSFVGFVYGLFDFYVDAFDLKKSPEAAEKLDKVGLQRAGIFSAILAPPAAIAAVNPDIFLKALDAAGAYGISVLFGILPATMAWKQRYDPGVQSTGATEALVPGGKFSLGAIVLFASGVIVQQTLEKSGLL